MNNHREGNLFISKEDIGGRILPIRGTIKNGSNKFNITTMSMFKSSIIFRQKKIVGPLHVWKCISCNKKFKKSLYSHRECPYCGSDLVVLIDITQL